MAETITPTQAETMKEIVVLGSVDEATRRLDQYAVARAASGGEAIASIGKYHGMLLDLMVATGEVSKSQKTEVATRAGSIQGKRMANIRGNTQAKVARLGAGTLGLFNGTDIILGHGIVQEGGEDLRTTFIHEWRHKLDGLPSKNLDKSYVPETGINALDRRFHDRYKKAMTPRGSLERRSTKDEQAAGGEGSEMYIEDYVNPKKELDARAQKMGVDLSSADEQYVDDNDETAYSNTLVKVAALEIAEEEGSEGLAELAHEAEEKGDPALEEIIAEVREDFENGPKGREEQRKRQEQLVAMAA